MPRSLCAASSAHTRLGSEPTPICRQAPSETISATIRAIFRARSRRWQLQKWYMVLNDRVYFCDMEQRTSENSWHVFINLNNETLCAPRYGTRIIIPSAECEIAMFVHRRHRNQECIHIDFLG